MPAAIPGRRPTQLRINETVYEKVRVISKLENRTINSQLEYFIAQGVRQYEAQHGPVPVPDEAEQE